MRHLSDRDALAVVERAPSLSSWPRWTLAFDRRVGDWLAHELASHDRVRAVRAALAAVRVVASLAVDSEDAATTRASLEARIDVVTRWLEAPTLAHQTLASASFDATRQTHAWSDFDLADAWVDEAADFALHAVWSGAVRGPLEPRTPSACAALAALCAARALALEGRTVDDATLEVARTIAEALD